MTGMSTPSITVVIPAYNAEATISRAIDSVLNQTVSVFEIVVVDDGSTDDTAAVVRGYGPKVRLIQQTNSRTAAARNRGLDAANGDWIAFLDADDYWELDKVSRQLAIVDQHPQVSVLAGRYYAQEAAQAVGQEAGQEIVVAARKLLRFRQFNWFDRLLQPRGGEAFRIGTLMWTGSVMMRRSLIGSKRFVSGLEPAEDRDFWIRMAATGTVFLDSTPLATAVLEPGSISRSNIAVDCEKMLQVINRNSGLLSVGQRLYWRSYVRYRWANDPSPAVAIPMLFRSLIGWPLPFFGMPSKISLGRIKRLAVLLRSAFTSSPKCVVAAENPGGSIAASKPARVIKSAPGSVGKDAA